MCSFQFFIFTKMGIVDFKILFDNPVKTYFPGETVTGQIILVLDSSKKCRGVRVKIAGEAKTSWSETRRSRKRNRSRRFVGEEIYFLTKYYLVGSASGDLNLDSGEHIFPFKQVLLPNLPCSFESKLGHIRYTVKATIDRPWKFDNETKAAFTVISKYDLNTDPNASEPISVNASKTFGCFSQTPPLSVDLQLPVKGYVPGQSIPIKVNIDNQSGVEIFALNIKLEKHVTFRVTRPQSAKKKKSTTILEINQGKVVGNEGSFYGVFDVPSLPPSSLNNCKIIELMYAVELEACIDKFCSRNLRISAPILIGTVPLMNYPSSMYFSNETRDEFFPTAPPESTPSPSTSPSAPPDYLAAISFSKDFELPPPTYEESMFAADHLQDQDDSDHVIGIREPFAPRYPVYNFSLPS